MKIIESRNEREGKYAGKRIPAEFGPNFETLPARHCRTGINPYDMWLALKPHYWPKEAE